MQSQENNERKDYYTFLNLPRTASDSDVNLAIFEAINKLCDKDENSLRLASDELVEIQKTEILSIVNAFATPESRLQYDQLLLNREFWGPNYEKAQKHYAKSLLLLIKITDDALTKAALDFMIDSSIISNMESYGNIDCITADLKRRQIEIKNEDRVRQIQRYKLKLLQSAKKIRQDILEGKKQ